MLGRSLARILALRVHPSSGPHASHRKDMHMRPALLHLALTLTLILGSGPARAVDQALPLQAGTYVVSSYRPCQEAPLAGVTRYNGLSFEGPHASNCQTSLLRQRGSSYRVKTTCTAMGDGSPAVQSASVQDIRVKSRTALVVDHGKKKIEYGLCPGFH